MNEECSRGVFVDSPIDSLEKLFERNLPEYITEKILPFQDSFGYVDEFSTFHRTLDTPKVIFCHDMMGGYLPYDSTLLPVPEFPSYRFIHWHLIDIFVYFSHHLITIPPISWINVAHRHNKRVYGTFIIENSENDLFKKVFCQEFDSSQPFCLSPSGLAAKLDKIRRQMKFEGWLINIETAFPSGDESRVFLRMITFLGCLKSHGSEVIWYDAVTSSGKLDWQNALTEQNSDYFRAAKDGIFLNYNWTAQLLRSSQNITKDAFESRRVFVGVDCFGRGCPGGGGFNTKEALELIIAASESQPTRPLSVALFAPAWSFETRQHLASIIPSENLIESSIRTSQLISDLDHAFWDPLEAPLARLRAIGTDINIVNGTITKYLHLPVTPYSSNEYIINTNMAVGLGLYEITENGDSKRIRLRSILNNQQILPQCRVSKFTPPFLRSVASDSIFTSPSFPESEKKFNVITQLEFTEFYCAENCLRVLIYPCDIAKPADLSDKIKLELFTFPNLSLSKNAEFALLLQSKSDESFVIEMIKLFVDICILPRASIFSTQSYAVTHRQYLDLRPFSKCRGHLSTWTRLSAELGKQLAASSLEEIIILRKIGAEFPCQKPISFLLGRISFTDHDYCLL